MHSYVFCKNPKSMFEIYTDIFLHYVTITAEFQRSKLLF